MPALSDHRAALVASELRLGRFGDPRRGRRVAAVAQALARRPSASFPKAMGTDTALEGCYRLLNNPRVSAESILLPHYEATTVRCAAVEGEVLVVHDTSAFSFSGEEPRAGLGRLNQGGHGFFGHFSLAVAEADGLALGMLALQTWTRQGPSRWRGKNKVHKSEPSIESKRWLEGARLAETRLGEKARPIHVADREADAYELMASMIDRGSRFVFRLTHDRVLADRVGYVSDAIAEAEAVVERAVHVGRRRGSALPGTRAKYPARRERLAQLALRAATLELRRPSNLPSSLPERLRLHVVNVREVLAKSDADRIEWNLVTNESIADVAAIERVVDAYRQRWVIEEYFDALKNGCAVERRQLETLDALLKGLAIFVPIAWSLLRLRDLPRVRPNAPAAEVLTEQEIEVLRAVRKRPLPRKLTTLGAMEAVAALGGHIKNNGVPGWRVLARGYEDLLLYLAGWEAAKEAQRLGKM